MKIAIIGKGNVGAALGGGWRKAGHDVSFGLRRPDDARARQEAEEAGGKPESVLDAIAGADVVVLAVPWKVAVNAVKSFGDLGDKVLLDCTNPLKPDLSGLEVGTDTSGCEMIASAARGGRVVKIFNTTGADNMANPNYGDTPVTMLYAGDDDEAKEIAAGLARDVGFEPIDFGSIRAARLLEPLALAWINLALKQGMGTDFAVQIMRRP